MSNYPSTVVGRTSEVTCGNNQEKVNHVCYAKCPANSTRNASDLELCDCNTGFNKTSSGSCVKCVEPTPYWDTSALQCRGCSDYTQWDASSNSCVECSSSQKFNTETKKCVDFDFNKYWYNNTIVDSCPENYTPNDARDCVAKTPETGGGNGGGNEPEEPPKDPTEETSYTKWIIIGGIILVAAIIGFIMVRRMM